MYMLTQFLRGAFPFSGHGKLEKALNLYSKDLDLNLVSAAYLFVLGQVT